MHRLTGHAWLLLAAAAGAAICLEVLNLERNTPRAGSAVAAATAAPSVTSVGTTSMATGTIPVGTTSAKRKHTASSELAAIELEPEQVSALSAKEPLPPPKLISPPVEVKRPPKKSVVAASDPAPKRTADTGMKPPAFVRTLLDGVNAVLGTP